MSPQILRPGQPPPPGGGPPAPGAMMLITCHKCGLVILVPGEVGQAAAQQHGTYCIRPLLDRILALLEPGESANGAGE